MRLRIHRGTREIGGTCVELDSGGERIVLDLGLPLNAADIADVPLPPVAGLETPDPHLHAVVLSHGHRDHWGLLPKCRSDLPLVMGRAGERILRAAANFVPGGYVPTAIAHLDDGRPLRFGPFVVSPYLVDHSGFDAYAVAVEADGRRLFYSGDLRAHGKKGALFDRLIAHPPAAIDVMLMEGSSLGRLNEEATFASEDDLEVQFVERFKASAGMALVVCSAQNIDRIVTVYRAAKRTGRTLVVDAYAAEVLKATGHNSIPKPVPGWPNMAVFIPQRQRVHLKRNGIAALVNGYRDFRLWPAQLAALAPRAVMLFRGWMFSDLERAGALAGARVIWSQWEGYLQDGAGARTRAECAARALPFEVIHTSGHASPPDLKRLAAAVAPRRLIPIHTFERERFPILFDNVTLIDDGQWIEV